MIRHVDNILVSRVGVPPFSPTSSASTLCPEATMTVHEYQVIGRRKPTPTQVRPPIYRMRIFAPNDVIAKSRFWYFMKTLKRLKRNNGEILQINEVLSKKPLIVSHLNRLDPRTPP